MNQIPVTVLTGFLGAGKTTLLNRVLTENHGRTYAVIVNEFGEIGIDNDLVAHTDEELFEMSNGCICCQVRGDLIRILRGLLKRGKAFDGILVETTGLADPSPVIQTFALDDFIAERTALDAILTVVDARHFPAQLADHHEAKEQAVYADILILNKTDLVSPAELAAVEARLRRLNPSARILPAHRCQVPVDEILGRQAFDLTRMLTIEPAFFTPEAHEHHHDEAIESLSLTSQAPLDLERFKAFIGPYLQDHGQDVYRCKGILHIAGNDQRFVFQGVHMLLEMTWGLPWREDEPRVSRAVFIGKTLDRQALTAGFAACAA